MQIIHTIYYVNLYFLVIYNTYCRIFDNMGCPHPLFSGSHLVFCGHPGGIIKQNHLVLEGFAGRVHSLALKAPLYGECVRDEAVFEIAMHES